MAALVMMSVDANKTGKLKTLFDAFDTDGDGCLLYDQILTLCCTIAVQRPVVEHCDTVLWAAALAFQDEPALQVGRRMFEAIVWQLTRHSDVEGGIISWWELV